MKISVNILNRRDKIIEITLNRVKEEGKGAGLNYVNFSNCEASENN